MKFLREPLSQFAIFGCLLFALFLAINQKEDSGAMVVVSAAQQQQLTASFARAWRRPPTEQEFKGLVDDWVKEELANREALAMGLGDQDIVIRRRLRQKYETLMEQFDTSTTPTQAQLLAWFQSHESRYQLPASYRLHQRFFSTTNRDDAEYDALQALEKLAAAETAVGVEPGDPIALPAFLENASADALASRFGSEFSTALQDKPTGRWLGPIPSAFGVHVVFIARKTSAQLPELDTIREKVLQDWRANHLREAREKRYARLLDNYRVEIEP